MTPTLQITKLVEMWADLLDSGEKALETTITVVPITHQVQRKKKHTVLWTRTG